MASTIIVNNISFVMDTMWMGMRAIADVNPNGGQSSADVYIRDLLTGGAWQAVGAMTGVNLGLSSGSGTATDVANWDRVYTYMASGVNGIDNLSISASSVPVPGSLVLFALGVLAYGRWARRGTA